MRSALSALVILFASAPVASAAAIGARMTTGACFFRLEENGILNVRPSSIVVDGHIIGVIIGGQFKCFTLRVGNHVAKASSRDPYNPASNHPSAWESAPFTLDIRRGYTIYVRISPKSSGAAYIGPWQLSQDNAGPDEDEFNVR
jgi:hypothetical protein